MAGDKKLSWRKLEQQSKIKYLGENRQENISAHGAVCLQNCLHLAMPIFRAGYMRPTEANRKGKI